MSNPGDGDLTPITSVQQLADYIAAGCKPRAEWVIGTEHEKFGFRRRDKAPPPYEPDGIRAMLEQMLANGGSAIRDGANLIGLKRGSASISLEPAGQFELSGGLMPDLHATRHELYAHLNEVAQAGADLGLAFAPLGFHPTMPRDAMPWMPKGRYAIMRRYMQMTGRFGLDMMTRTCTVQVNLDYSSEEDMRRKLRVSLALQPVITALCANGPFTEGKPNGFLSFRAQVWTDTDADRTGMPDAFFNADFGFDRYVEWLLDVPMYFVVRDGKYVDVAGESFRRFMKGELGRPDLGPATIGDFADHMTTAFTDVRLKRFLEMRGADAGTPEVMLAQSAFWVGLLYDESALAAAEDLVRPFAPGEIRALRGEVPRYALDAPWQNGTVRDLAREAVAIAETGLRNRARRDADNRDEHVYLAPFKQMTDGGPTQAQHWLQRYRDTWQGDAQQIFEEASIF